MVSWGGENTDRQPGSEGSRADRLALENAPLSPTLTRSRNPRVGHFPSLFSPGSGISLPRAWLMKTEAKPTNRPRKLSVDRQEDGSRRNARGKEKFEQRGDSPASGQPYPSLPATAFPAISAYLGSYHPHPAVGALGFHSIVFLLIIQSTMNFSEGPLSHQDPRKSLIAPRGDPTS